jgi:hypothetical protein
MSIDSFDEYSFDYFDRLYDVVMFVMRDDVQYETRASHAP